MEKRTAKRRIDYVEFPALDIERTKAFYSGVFGWEFRDHGRDYTSFEDGRIGGGFTKAAAVTPGGPLVVLYAPELERMEESVKVHGGTITRPIFPFPGGRRFHFKDPNGNELAIWSE
jgi:uncharacterized protein